MTIKSFSENLKQLTKINDFLLFLRFHEYPINCFHHRYEFCMEKYPIAYILAILPIFSKI